MPTYKHLRREEIPPVPTPEQLAALLDGKDMEELAKLMWKAEREMELLEAKVAPISALYEYIRLRAIPDSSEASGVKSVTVQFTDEYSGRVSLTPDMHVQITNKEEGYDWLRDHGHGDLIQPTVNAGSLKAAMKRRIERGEGTPPAELFKLTPFKRASITKA